MPTHKRYDSDDVSIASLHEREREYLVKIEGRGALCKRTGGHHDAVHTHTRLWLFSMRPFDNVLDRRLYLLSRDDFPYLRGLDTAAFSTRIRSTKYFFDSSFFSLYCSKSTLLWCKKCYQSELFGMNTNIFKTATCKTLLTYPKTTKHQPWVQIEGNYFSNNGAKSGNSSHDHIPDHRHIFS